jgi:hypothetical protein
LVYNPWRRAVATISPKTVRAFINNVVHFLNGTLNFFRSPCMTTALRVEYTFYSWHCVFPDAIEQALENDFVMNRHLYNDQTLKYIQCLLVIEPEISTDSLLEAIRNIPPSINKPLQHI